MSRSGYPTFITVNPDGTVGYDFDGHIHADGLDLDAGTIVTPPSENRVRWVEVAGGAVIAEMFGAIYDAGPVVGTAITQQTRATTRAGTREARLNLNAYEGDGSAGVIGSQVQAVADGLSADILTGGGQSGFLRWLASTTRRVQIGSQQFAAAVGDNFLSCNLGTPWTGAHDLFLAAPQAVTSFPALGFRGAYVISNSQGGCVINTSLAQNVLVRWLSIGT